MSKSYYSIGLMSGTSMDGVDASIIQSDGETKYKVIMDEYFEYSQNIFKDLTNLRAKIKSSKDLKKFSKEIKNMEEEITLFHARAANQILKKTKVNVDFIGFHGQTIYHNADEMISKQLGDGKLLSNLTKKTVVYNFRENDLKNGGEGAPLTPIFHKMLSKKMDINPVIFVNIGGIANLTRVNSRHEIHSSDCGPGMCLIDQWIRINSKKKFDKNGQIAKIGIINEEALEQYNDQIDTVWNQTIKSFDINDFNLDFIKGLSISDGAATLIEFTVDNIIERVKLLCSEKSKVVLCGGGRKNNFLIERIKKRSIDFSELFELKKIDDYGVDGDFIESQAFAYLAIRSYLKLPISFPETTNVKKSCSGGIIIKY